jgi:hypothetical protein
VIKKSSTFFLLLFLLTAVSISATGSIETDPVKSAEKFDFSTWKIQLPEANEAGTSVKEVKPAELAAGYTSEYFYYNEEGAMVFYCPVGIASTANSNYSRSEFRELIDGEHTDVNWSLHGTHILTTREKVTEVPSNGRTVVSQIHGIELDGSNGPVLVKVEYDGSQDAVVVLLKTATYPNAADERFYLRDIKLNEIFNTTIKVVEGRVFVTVTSGDKKLEASKNFYIDDPTWDNYRFYYKVGNYVQDSIKDYEGEASTVIVYDIFTSHKKDVEKIAPAAISLPESISLEKGNDAALEGTFAPFDTSDTGCLWEIVSGDDIIVLSSTGQITARKEGHAVIKAISAADASLSDTCSITVTEKTVKTAEVIYEEDFENEPGREWEFTNAEEGRLKVENGKLTWVDAEETISMKAILSLGDLPGTSTVEFDVNLTRLDIKDKGNTKEQSSYYYIDVNSASNENLFRIRSKADLDGGQLLNPRIVLSKGYLEPEINKDAALTPLGTSHRVTLVIRTDDHSGKANTTDIYIDGIKIGEKIENNSKQSAVSRLEIFSGTKDMLDFDIDNIKVYEGEKLPEGAIPSEVTIDPVSSYLAVGGSTRIVTDGNTVFEVIKGSDVVAVSDSGLITGLTAGNAIVKIGDQEEVTLTVVDALVYPETMEITEDFVSLNVGDSLNLQEIVKILPANATERDFKIAFVDDQDSASLEDNILTVVRSGEVKLMITSLGDESLIKFLTVSAVAHRSGNVSTIDFDDFEAGTQIDAASASWSVQKVDGTSLIAEVSSNKAKSGSNSLYLLDNSTADKPYALLSFANGAAAEGSVSFDVYIPGTNSKTSYINFGTGKNNSNRYFELRISGSGKVEYEAGSDDPDIASITTDQWHRYTVDWADGAFSVSIDGASIANATDVTVESTGLNVSNIPTTITFYTGDTSSTGTVCYIDNISSDLFE